MTAMMPTELRERLDRLADAHVADLETPLPIATDGGTTPYRTRLVLVAAAIAVLAGSWFLVRTAADDDSEESPAVRVETLGEPQLNLPGWTELPIVDPDDLDPFVAELLFDSERTDLDPTTLRTLDAGESTRFVGLSADHSAIYFAVWRPGRGLSSGGGMGSLMLINDNLVRWQSQSSMLDSTEAHFGLVPERIGTLLWDGEPVDVSDGTLYAIRSVDDPLQSGGSSSLTTVDGDPLFMIPTVGEPGSFMRGQIMVEGARVDVEVDSAICLRTPTGMRAAARHRTSGGVLIIGVTPEEASAQVVDDETFLFANATEDELTTTELGGGRLRVEIDSDELSGTIEVQCINPPTLEMLVAAMRGEG